MDEINDKTRIEFYLPSWPNIKAEYLSDRNRHFLLKNFLQTILPAGARIRPTHPEGDYTLIFNTPADALAFTLKWK